MLSSGEGLNDEELLRCFTQSGREEYFTEFYRRHKRKVFFSCRGLLRDDDDAMEAAQEIFLRVLRNPDRFTGPDAGAWLMTIARNVCLDRARRARLTVPFDEELEIAGPPNKGHDDLLMRVVLSQLKAIVAQLPTAEKKCIELIRDGYSYEIIASEVGGTTEDVRRLLQKAKREIRRRLGMKP